MSRFVQPEDFTGKYAISQDNFTEDDLQEYLDKYEDEYLCDLLGADLFALFIADFSAGPPIVFSEARFTKIFESFKIDDDDLLVRSDGMKEMLLGLIYFEYVRDQVAQNTVSGPVKPAKSISEQADTSALEIMNRYNIGITTYQAIRWFILDEKPEDYPEENSQFLSHASGL